MIFIESFCRTHSLSLSGKISYRLVDRWELFGCFPLMQVDLSYILRSLHFVSKRLSTGECSSDHKNKINYSLWNCTASKVRNSNLWNQSLRIFQKLRAACCIFLTKTEGLRAFACGTSIRVPRLETDNNRCNKNKNEKMKKDIDIDIMRIAIMRK